jgi:sec-independent protein translocase protein TatC
MKEISNQILIHIRELRSRIVVLVVFFILFFIIGLILSNDIIDFLKKPLELVLQNRDNVLYFTSPIEVFAIKIKISLLFAFMMSVPMFLFQFWKFIEPALHKNERKYILPFFLFSNIFFISGLMVSYFIIIPLSLDFLIKLGLEISYPIITLKEYIGLITMIMLSFSFIFETPLILILLNILGVLSVDFLRKKRLMVFIIILIISAVVTPPDPISQIGLALPLYLLFEMAILISSKIEKS